MKLFGSTTSPFARHCRIALEQTQQPYELVAVDYGTSAKESPTQKVPYAQWRGRLLTDSSTIIKMTRESAGQTFLASVEDFECFTLATTLLDTAINLFLLEKSGVQAKEVDYLQRQAQRLQTGLVALNEVVEPEQALTLDGHIRAVCFIDWALMRERVDFDGLDNLTALLHQAQQHDVFQSTDPRL